MIHHSCFIEVIIHSQLHSPSLEKFCVLLGYSACGSMRIWCQQLFAMIFLSYKIYTLEQFSDFFTASLKNKDIYLHFIVLRHKFMIILTKLQKKCFNYVELQRSIKIMTAYQVTKINVCNNVWLALKEQTYKNVPSIVMPGKKKSQFQPLTQELFFDPHIGVFKRSQNSLNYTLFGKLCAPESAQFLADSERKSISLTFQESPSVYFNVSFEIFLLGSHPWCFSEFFLMYNLVQSSMQAPIHIFCGERPSWAMIYPGNRMKVWIVTRRTSLLQFKFQISDPQNIITFHICQYYITNEDQPCYHKKKPYKIYFMTHIFTLVTHAFTYWSKSAIVHRYVVSIRVYEYKKMKILKSVGFDYIFDGPSVNHRKMMIRNGLLMSSFQATVVVTDFTKLLQDDMSAIFGGTDLVTKHFKSPLVGSKLVLNKSCDKLNCMVHEAYWLGTQNAFAITLTNAAYSGPREPVTKNYAGISVYELWYTKRFVYEVLRIHPENTLELNLENFTYIVDQFNSPQNLVIVYYYYSQFSFMNGEFLISKTDCPGFLIHPGIFHQNIKTCEIRRITPAGPGGLLFFFLLWVKKQKHKCATVTFLIRYEVQRVFDNNVAWYNHSCFSGIILTFKDFFRRTNYNADFVWKQLDVHNMRYIYQHSANYTLLEIFKHKGTSPTVQATSGFFSKLDLNASAQNGCDLQDIDGYMKAMPEQYSLLQLEDISSNWDLSNVRISTASSLDVHDLYALLVNFNNMLSKWAVFSFYWVNCSSSASVPIWIPYLNLERERYCRQKQLTYGAWQKAIELQGFVTIFPVKLSTCVGVCTAKGPVMSFIFHESTPKTALVHDDISDYYSSFALPYTQIILKNDVNLNVTLRFTRIARDFPLAHRDMDVNLSLFLPSNQTEILIPITVLPNCTIDKEIWQKQPCQFTINPQQPVQSIKLNISTRSLPVHSFSSVDHFYHLIPVCGHAIPYCLNKFVTWNQAHEMCRSMKMSLPAVYSQKDVREIQKTADSYQRNLSCVKQKEMDHSVEVLYNTIGIYVGINFDVSQYFSFQLRSIFSVLFSLFQKVNTCFIGEANNLCLSFTSDNYFFSQILLSIKHQYS